MQLTDKEREQLLAQINMVRRDVLAFAGVMKVRLDGLTKAISPPVDPNKEPPRPPQRLGPVPVPINSVRRP